MDDAMNDSDLVYLALQGNQQAADILFRRYYPSTFRYFKVQVRDQEVAQDLAQETFLKAWKNLPQVRKSFSGWLHTVAHSVWQDYLRRKQHSLHLSSLATEFDREDGQLAVETRILMREDIRDEIKKMPIMQQKCMELTIMEQLTPEEIVVRLGLKIGTVRTYISDGRNKLRKALFQSEEF